MMSLLHIFSNSQANFQNSAVTNKDVSETTKSCSIVESVEESNFYSESDNSDENWVDNFYDDEDDD